MAARPSRTIIRAVRRRAVPGAAHLVMRRRRQAPVRQPLHPVRLTLESPGLAGIVADQYAHVAAADWNGRWRLLAASPRVNHEITWPEYRRHEVSPGWGRPQFRNAMPWKCGEMLGTGALTSCSAAPTRERRRPTGRQRAPKLDGPLRNSRRQDFLLTCRPTADRRGSSNG